MSEAIESGLPICPCGCKRQVMTSQHMLCAGCRAEWQRSPEYVRWDFYGLHATKLQREHPKAHPDDGSPVGLEINRLLVAGNVAETDFIKRRSAERLNSPGGTPWVGPSPRDMRPWGYHRELTAEAVDLKAEWAKHAARLDLEEAEEP